MLYLRNTCGEEHLSLNEKRQVVVRTKARKNKSEKQLRQISCCTVLYIGMTTGKLHGKIHNKIEVKVWDLNILLLETGNMNIGAMTFNISWNKAETNQKDWIKQSLFGVVHSITSQSVLFTEPHTGKTWILPAQFNFQPTVWPSGWCAREMCYRCRWSTANSSDWVGKFLQWGRWKYILTQVAIHTRQWQISTVTHTTQKVNTAVQYSVIMYEASVQHCTGDCQL